MADKLEERLVATKPNSSFSEMQMLGFGKEARQVPVNPDGPAALGEITRLNAENERLSAEITAWGHVASGLKAYLQDRQHEGDYITPEKVLSILDGDIRIMEERSRQIYAATQHRSQAAEAHAARLNALVDELVAALEEVINSDSFLLALAIAKARALITKASRDSGHETRT